MPILGTHKSIAGGYHKAVEAAAACGCDCVQLFTKNTNQWRAKEITAAEAQRFRTTLAELKISHPIGHDSYLINLSSPDAQLWTKSIDAFVGELRRADLLGLEYLVAHPGAYTSSSEAKGIKRVIQALDEIHGQTRGLAVKCLLETTAGQGTSLGCRFEHLAAFLDGVNAPERLGICFDTCHVFAAGYPLRSKKEYEATIGQFDAMVGVKQIKAFHLNDSRRELGSRVDRHAHIGRGRLGTEAFRHLLGDRRFGTIPMYLETPKEMQNGVDMDAVNLQLLRSLTPRGRKNEVNART